MNSRKKSDWFSIVALTTQTPNEHGFVIYNEEKFNFQYVGYSQNRMGYLTIWNASNKKATRVLNCRIPDSVSFIEFDEAEAFEHSLPKELNYELDWLVNN
ncbi:hypothetical protein [Spirosoma sp. 48-14]|uniref:hypothetical protein n=1 Tax=Spirosoma sp. 48-14 TaxID=1895854 RepID=UPI000964D254|nr:hypothetical protein [Spirosoma sp. 48-14]OJW80383.1 MAG: hypothetical protein BGO59_33375 [Spirosoma sp. 48-14]